MAALAEAARRKLEALMESSGYPYSDYFRKHYVRGLTEGEAKGKAEGKAYSVLAVLQARGVPVRVQDRARVLDCHNEAMLDGWIVAAATAASVAEVLATKPPRRRRATAPRPRRPAARPRRARRRRAS